MSDETVRQVSQYLSFKLEEETYALNVVCIREAMELELTHITKIPRTPEFLRGVINVRGGIVPVIDMRIKLSMEKQETTIDSCIIVIEVPLAGESTVLGLLVDSVKEVIDLGSDEISAPPAMGNQLKTEFIEGIGKKDEQFIIILKITEILTSEELVDVNIKAKELQPEKKSEE